MHKNYRLLAVPLVLFTLAYIILSGFNRYASDDFEFLYRLMEFGFRGSVGYFYDSWNTRWMAISWMNLVFMITSYLGTLAWYPVFSMLCLWMAFYRFISVIYPATVTRTALFAGFAAISFFYAAFSISDVFFWINTSTMYLWATIGAIIIMATVINRYARWPEILFAGVCGVYAGGAYEPLALVLMILLVMIPAGISRGGHSNLDLKNTWFKCIFILLCTGLAFAISYNGEGHVIRASFLPVREMDDKAWILVKAMVKMFGIQIPLKLPGLLLFSFPWFLAGMHYPFARLTPVIMRRATLICTGLIVISLLPVVLVMSEMGPERAWTQNTLYLVIYFGMVAAYAGARARHLLNEEKAIKIYSVLSILFVLSTTAPKCLQAYHYQQRYDARMEQLESLQRRETKGVITLEPLPTSGWLHSAEISPDPGHFTNVHLKKYMGLGFDVITEGEE